VLVWFTTATVTCWCSAAKIFYVFTNLWMVGRGPMWHFCFLRVLRTTHEAWEAAVVVISGVELITKGIEF
jgi:hypothetical protein